MAGTASSYEVKLYLRDRITKLRAKGFSWARVQSTVGPDAWAVWLMVENVPAPTVDSKRSAKISFAEMGVKK